MTRAVRAGSSSTSPATCWTVTAGLRVSSSSRAETAGCTGRSGRRQDGLVVGFCVSVPVGDDVTPGAVVEVPPELAGGVTVE